MNRYPAWANIIILLLVLLGTLVALPNLFGEDPAVQVSRDTGVEMTDSEVERVRLLLADEPEVLAVMVEAGRATVRFDSVEAQLRLSDELRQELGRSFVVALTMSPRTPDFLRALGLKPMSLGLDLRGGVHFLFEVDMPSAIRQRLNAYAEDFSTVLRDNRIGRSVDVVDGEVRVRLSDPEDAVEAERLIRERDADLDLRREATAEGTFIIARMTDEQVRERQDFAIQQNTVTLRNRVNELGVAEPLVQRQGADRIVVQLPGVQDPAQAERVLGATATLEFRLVCEGENAFEALRRGRAPIGCELFEDRDGNPVLLRRRTIATGDQLIDASQGFSEGSPAVFVRLDSKGAASMLETTRTNLRKPMAVVFVEQKRDVVERDGERTEETREERRVINIATIQGVFSSNFQITGLGALEARDLALLLRAGALAAPVFKVEERTVGPSLGKENIDKGMQAIGLGFLAVVIFMVLYYRSFGLIADIAVLLNLVLLVALMSLLQASLTLPGIAGIVLTVGMAVDANVLINERIREEVRNGNSPQASIHAGYEKAFGTIADANLTTLIAGLVLFVFGTGPIKGFAVVLCLGILTSMFTAIFVTRAIVNLVYGNRRLVSLPV